MTSLAEQRNNPDVIGSLVCHRFGQFQHLVIPFQAFESIGLQMPCPQMARKLLKNDRGIDHYGVPVLSCQMDLGKAKKGIAIVRIIEQHLFVKGHRFLGLTNRRLNSR